MNTPYIATAGSALRHRLVEDMTLRGFGEKTQHDYIRIVSRFAAFLGRSPASASAEDIRRFQLEQREAGMHPPAMSSHVAGLRFFFTTTPDRPDLSRRPALRASRDHWTSRHHIFKLSGQRPAADDICIYCLLIGRFRFGGGGHPQG